ncbi:OsmC family protein [Qingshengfaniella alkalisoli]|uniref:OsmC family protein n=1 Tax=Qingshengfaniella alkalisoli TaxID=2599296 RepID=A0A5B8ITJ2_9RHOB|nr:OsmC family protein [Qingshengfaniella alkalisoli]QDY68763.1 OsmC family protein [Qingshengfaniella alkalisoli]
MPVTSGSAKWSGGLKDGKGIVSTKSGAISDQPYGFKTRFEGEPGTNPEEMIGAAHAGCFSMALSMILGQKDLVADEIATTAKVTLDQVGEGFEITKIHLDVTAKISGATEDDFAEAAQTAKENCPVSKVLNAEITMDARLA